jgi:hypothetical protein
MPKKPGNRFGMDTMSGPEATPTLNDLGIHEKQSQCWQAIARVRSQQMGHACPILATARCEVCATAHRRMLPIGNTCAMAHSGQVRNSAAGQKVTPGLDGRFVKIACASQPDRSANAGGIIAIGA